MRVLFTILSLLALGHLADGKYVKAGELSESYDYIVVGGGTGGATVASRLSEINATVLLIEAGGLDQGEEFVLLPIQVGQARQTPYDWNFTTEVMPNMANRLIAIPAGRVIGGSSVLNGMMFDRGAGADYDAWGDLGNTGWNFSALLPYFKKNERFTPPPADLATKYNITWDLQYHGTDGVIHSSFPSVFSVLQGYFLRALASLGIQTEVDGYGGRALNGFWSPNSLDPVNKTRSYSRSYVELAINRPNFHVLLYSQVTKLVTAKDGSLVRVTGVEFAADAQSPRFVVKVNKEVVVSGGVVGSPRLLQISGIGPSSVLQSANVSVVVDLPGVGTNYQDHTFLSVVGIYGNAPKEPTYSNDEARKLYYENKTGPWTVSGPTTVGFIPFAKVSNRSVSILDTLLAQAPELYLPAGSHPTVVAGYAKQKQVLGQHLKSDLMAMSEIIFQNGFAISQAHQFSRGFTKIKSSDPFENPMIDLRYHTNPIDNDVIAESIRFTRKVMQTDTMAELKYTEATPGPAATSDADLNAYTASRIGTMFHSCCSNPMQPLELGGVIDAKLKVYGTSNLRLADASIFPLIPGTHLQSTVYAVAERAADFIKADSSFI